jgi:hypothetical protein
VGLIAFNSLVGDGPGYTKSMFEVIELNYELQYNDVLIVGVPARA